MSDKLKFCDDTKFIWFLDCTFCCSSTLVLIGDKLLGLLSGIVFDESVLFCNILPNGDPSYVWLLHCRV